MEALLVPHDGAERRLSGAARRFVDLAELHLPDLHDWISEISIGLPVLD